MSDRLRKYKKLDHVEHVLLRPDTYIGSIFLTTLKTHVLSLEGDVQWREVTYSPALLKIFDEVIQNSYDFSKRPEGKHVNSISVTVNQLTGEISVMDNGGIPVEIHPDYNEYIPDFIFGELMSGENYDDSETREGAGTNGFGSKLTNIYSTMFRVETADGKKKYERTYRNNLRERDDAKIIPSSLRYTKLTFVPDYDRLGVTLDDDNLGMIVRRVYEIAALAPWITVTLNGRKLEVKGFESYAKRFNPTVLFAQNEQWRVALLPAGDDGFAHLSFVNGTATKEGGTHVDYIMDQVVEGIREHIKKKTKQDIKPSELKNHFTVMIDATVINPRFTGQTKGILATPISKFGTSFRLDDKFIKKIIASPIVVEIIEWAKRKLEMEEDREARERAKAAAKASTKHIIKYEPANEKKDRSKCALFICEGDSALAPLLGARISQTQGVFPMRGKGMNVRGAKRVQLMANEELVNLMTILGLQLGVKADRSQMRYGRLVVATDQDADGHHVFGLIYNMFHELWPELVLDGTFLYKLKTPIVRVTMKGQTLEFFTEQEFKDWETRNQGKKYESSYLKGLGSNETTHFKKYMHDEQYHVAITIDGPEDVEALDIAFSQLDGAADKRKEWLYGN